MLIIFMVATNVLLWTFLRNAEYNRAVMERTEEEAQRSSEKIAVSHVNYSVQGGYVRVELKVANEGPVPVQITTLWVLDRVTQKHGYNDMVNINLRAGQTLNFTGSSALLVPIEGLEYGFSSEFSAWFVTARGNLIPLEDRFTGTKVIIQPSGGYPKVVIGALMLDFDTFRHFTYASDAQLANYPTGTLGFNIPKQTYLAFGCYLTNVDTMNRTMIIDSHSLLWQPGRPGVPEGAAFVVNVNADGTINGAYSQITLKHGETKMFVFASVNDLGLAAFKRYGTPNVVTTVATNLLIHGTLGSSPYAQNIPFVSIFLS